MRLDNSAVTAFWECPLRYRERYVEKIEPDRQEEALEFGSRVHKLLEARLCKQGALPAPDGDVPLEDEALEAEAQELMAAYAAYWGPTEPWEVLAAEMQLSLPVGAHEIVVKIDGVVRRNGRLWVLEHKTEKRGSKRNHPLAWAARPQGSIYPAVVAQAMSEPVEGVILDVLTRQSPRGQEPPLFRRDDLVRTREQQEQVLREMAWVADRLEELKDRPQEEWPANRNNCHNGFWKCPYYELHVYGRDENTLRAYRPAKEYLVEQREQKPKVESASARGGAVVA